MPTSAHPITSDLDEDDIAARLEALRQGHDPDETFAQERTMFGGDEPLRHPDDQDDIEFRYFTPLSNAADEYVRWSRNPGQRVYTGIDEFDAAMRGIAPSELMLVVGFAHCVPTDVEALTTEGWKRHEELRPGDRLWSLDPETGAGRWTILEQINVFDYDGPMVNLQSRGVDVACTPAHRWGVTSQWNHERNIRTPKMKTTRDLNTSDWIPKASQGLHVESTIIPDSLVEVLGWAASEGCYQRAGQAVHIYQSRTANPDNCARIEKALVDLGWDYSVYENKGCNVYSPLSPNGATIRKWLGRNKMPTTMLLDAMTPAQCALYIDVSVLADGYVCGSNTSTRRFVTSRPDEAGMVCAIAAKAGIPFSHRSRHQVTEYGEVTMQVVTLGSNQHAKVSNLTTETTRYAGDVWCPTTESGTWFAKSNGTTFFTGNSGKTVFTTQVVLNNAHRNVCIFSPDETRVLVLIKLFSIQHGIGAEEVEQRLQQQDSEMEELLRNFAAEHFPNLGVFDEISDITLFDTALDEYEAAHGETELVVIDYAQLVTGAGEDVAQIINAIKGWGKRRRVAIILLHQSSRSKGAGGSKVTIDSGGYGGEQQALFLVGVRRKKSQYEQIVNDLEEKIQSSSQQSTIDRCMDLKADAEADLRKHKDTITFSLVKNKRPPGRLVEDVDFHLDPDTGRVMPFDSRGTGTKVSWAQQGFADGFDYEEPF